MKRKKKKDPNEIVGICDHPDPVHKQNGKITRDKANHKCNKNFRDPCTWFIPNK